MSRVELKARDEMTDEEFHEMLMRSYRQAMRERECRLMKHLKK